MLFPKHVILRKKPMPEPTPGYDDPTVIPKQRLVQVLEELESQLRELYQFPAEALLHDFEPTFVLMRQSAEELSSEHRESIERIIESCQLYRVDPHPDHLERIQMDVDQLKTLLLTA